MEQRKKQWAFTGLGLAASLLIIFSLVVKLLPPVFLFVAAALYIGVIVLGIQMMGANHPIQREQEEEIATKQRKQWAFAGLLLAASLLIVFSLVVKMGSPVFLFVAALLYAGVVVLGIQLLREKGPLRRGRTGLLIALLVILLAALMGSGAIYYNFSHSTPQETMDSYCTALKNSDAQTLSQLLASDLQQKIHVSDIQKSFKLEATLGGLKTCTVNRVQESGSTATAFVTVTYRNGVKGPVTGTLHDENGVWKISQLQ